MTRTRLSNTMNQNARENLKFQLYNVESAIGKHPIDSREFRYLSEERKRLLRRLEDQ